MKADLISFLSNSPSCSAQTRCRSIKVLRLGRGAIIELNACEKTRSDFGEQPPVAKGIVVVSGSQIAVEIT